jgi:hypothetical protein
MDPTIEINERVDIIARYSKTANPEVDNNRLTFGWPCKMKWRNRIIDFTEVSLLHPTVAGKRMIHVYHATDGVTDYRIEFDAEVLTWTLVCLISGEDHA